MRFWLFLSKMKPRNETSRCMLCLKCLSWWSGVILGLKIWIFIIWGGWSSDRYERSLNFLYVPDANFGSRWTHNRESQKSLKICARVLYFWTLFCPKPTRNALYTSFSGQNLPNASKMIIFALNLQRKRWITFVQIPCIWVLLNDPSIDSCVSDSKLDHEDADGHRPLSELLTPIERAAVLMFSRTVSQACAAFPSSNANTASKDRQEWLERSLEVITRNMTHP